MRISIKELKKVEKNKFKAGIARPYMSRPNMPLELIDREVRVQKYILEPFVPLILIDL